MSKIFKAILNSKKTQHPEGDKTVIVYVSDKMKKDAEVKAVKELEFWEPENHALYKKPQMTELDAEQGQAELNEYLSSKETHGQTDLHDHVDDDEEEDQGLGDMTDVRKAIINHDDYINCASPYDPSEFINSVEAILNRLIAESGEQISFKFIAGKIKKLQTMRQLCSADFVSENIIDPIAESRKNVRELAEHAAETFKDTQPLENKYQAGPGAPDYTKPSDCYIEVSKYNLINNELLRIGVGVYGGNFLASFDINIREKESGYTHAIQSSITSFANKVFKNKVNAIEYAYGMAIDTLLTRVESLNKNLMNKEAKDLEAQVGKLISADKQKLFEDNKSSTTLSLIPEFCDLPDELRGQQVQENLPEPQESLPAATKNEPEQPVSEPETGKEYGDQLLSLPADAINVYQHLFANCLATADGHNDYTADQYDEAAEKLAIVFDEYADEYGARFDAEKTKHNLLNNDWDDANECAKSFLNIRTLRSLIRENAEIGEKVKVSEEVLKFHVYDDVSFEIKVIQYEDDVYHHGYYLFNHGNFGTTDRVQMVNKDEVITFVLNRIKCEAKSEKVFDERFESVIDAALTSPLEWFEDCVKHSPIGAPKVETKPQTAPETKPFNPVEKQPEPQPETKPAAPEETKPAAVEYELAPATDIFEMLLDEQDQDKEPEPTQLEKDIAAHNETIAALTPGEKVIFDDLPNLVYHGSDGISSTKLKDACVSLMYYNGVNNTGEIEKSRGVHFDVGNLAHTLILEPEQVELEYKQKPDMPEPTEPQRKKYDAWVKDGKPENQSLKPSDAVIEKIEEWEKLGKPENQSLKPNDKVILTVEDWIAEGRPENQNLKPSGDVISKVENHGDDPENNPAPTEKQKQKFIAWMDAGYPEPYSSKPTDKQIEEYEAWANAGKPEPYKGKPTDKQLDEYAAWANAGKPDPYKDKPTDICIERCAFWDEYLAENENMIIVDKEDWKIAQAMADSVRQHEFAGKFISHPARVSERSHYKVDEETGLLVKTRPDIEVGAVLADVKTIQMRGNPDEEWLKEELRREIKRRKYHVSAAMYLDVTGAKQFVWIFVNKEPGYHWVAVVKMSMNGSEDDRGNYIPSLFEQGMEVYRTKLTAIKQSQETNYWPAPVSIQNVVEI